MGNKSKYNHKKPKIEQDIKLKLITVTISEYTKHLRKSMRQNRISEDRVDKIIIEAMELFKMEGEERA